MRATAALPSFALALALALCAACATAHPVSAGGPALSPADAAIAEGQRAVKEGRTDEALAAFRRALAADGRRPDAMRMFVEAHHLSFRIDQVIRELEEACAARPQDDVAHYGLGLALYAKSPGLEARAIEHLAEAVRLHPEVAEYHFRLGVVHLQSERYTEAVVSLTRARDLDPAQARHHVPLALALSRTGDRAGALAALRAILALNPDAHDVEVGKKVMARITDPFREFPKAIEADFQRGLDYMDKADAPQQAIVAFEEILERFPDLAVVHAALGLCLQRLDDSSRAMEEFRRALELAPDDARNHLYIADLYFTKERIDRAAEEYRAAIERDPLSDHAYERLGAIALQRGNNEEASGLLKTLVMLRPDDLGARQALGLALSGQGALDAAAHEFEAILLRDAKNVEAMMRLALVDVERSKRASDPAGVEAARSRAIKRLEQVLDLQPQNVYAAKTLEQLKP